MKFFTITTFLIVFAIKSFACSCGLNNIGIEYYASKYVFYGEIIAKDYSTDSTRYTLTFDVFQFYKGDIVSKKIKFENPAEPEYTGKIPDSCDETYYVGQKYLVFAFLSNNRLVFSNNCSNTSLDPSQKELDRLSNLKDFKLGRFYFGYGSNSLTTRSFEKPNFNLDSALSKVNTKNFGPENYAVVMFDVNKNSKTVRSNIADFKTIIFNKKASSVGLSIIDNKKIKRPYTEFEKSILKISRRIKSWPDTYFTPTNEKINSRKYLTFRIDKEGSIKWSPLIFMF